MEPIELSGYIVRFELPPSQTFRLSTLTEISTGLLVQHDEKLFIARQKLLPKQIAANGLEPSLVYLPDSTILEVIQHYTREAGVRTLERLLGAVCRAKAVEYSRARDASGQSQVQEKDVDSATGTPSLDQLIANGYRVEVDPGDLELILGSTKHDSEELDETGRVGVSTGLAYQGSGNGGILRSSSVPRHVQQKVRKALALTIRILCADIETSLMPGSGRFHLTGQLGDVISESARLAFAWVKSRAFELGIADQAEQDVFKNVDLHLHLPAGSVKKDGPSAGVAIVVAIVSLSEYPVSPLSCISATIR